LTLFDFVAYYLLPIGHGEFRLSLGVGTDNCIDKITSASCPIPPLNECFSNNFPSNDAQDPQHAIATPPYPTFHAC